MAAVDRILIVDDDQLIRGFLTELLSDEGYSVQTAANGREALDVLASWPADIILLDLMMPEMDGWAFRAAQIENPALRRIPVIVITAARDIDDHRVALQAAAAIEKPFDLVTIVTAIRSLEASILRP